MPRVTTSCRYQQVNKFFLTAKERLPFKIKDLPGML